MALTVVPIERLPDIEIVASPPISAETQAIVDVFHRQLLSAPGGCDGPIMYCLRADDQHAELYQADYSHMMAFDSYGVTDLGLGPASIRLLLDDGAGNYLWARRSPELDDQGGHWSWSVAGAVDPGETIEETVLREAEEELDIHASDISGLRPLCLLSGLGFTSVWSATLRDGAVLTAKPDEVAELCWAPDPTGLSPLTIGTAAAWADVVRLAQRQTACV